MEKTPSNDNQDVELRKGPWTMEEDLILINHIVNHGEGVWNSLARSAGLKRTGKSCRLRWLNYLRPDVRRGNITHEEQQLIMELHARWGNRLTIYVCDSKLLSCLCPLKRAWFFSAGSPHHNDVFSDSRNLPTQRHVQTTTSRGLSLSPSLSLHLFPVNLFVLILNLNATAVGVYFSR
ncbi:hypothetical protein ACLOJK_001947 [Asimina triloba]